MTATRDMVASLFAAALLVPLSAGCGAGPQPRLAGHYVVQYRAVPVIAPIAQPAECCEVAQHPKHLTRCLVFRGLTHYRLGHRAYAHQLLRQAELLYRNGRRYWLPRVVVFQLQEALCDLEMRGVSPVILPHLQPQVGAAVSADAAHEMETIQ